MSPHTKHISEGQSAKHDPKRFEGRHTQSDSLFEKLPTDIQLKILEGFTLKEKLQAEMVCKSWLELLQCSHSSIVMTLKEESYSSAIKWLKKVGIQSKSQLHSLEMRSDIWKLSIPRPADRQCECTSVKIIENSIPSSMKTYQQLFLSVRLLTLSQAFSFHSIHLNCYTGHPPKLSCCSLDAVGLAERICLWWY